MNALIVKAIFVGVIRNQPGMLNLFHETGGWGEQRFLPLLILPIVLTLGWLGGVCGRSRPARARA